MLSHDVMARDANLYCNVQRCICLDTNFCPQLYICYMLRTQGTGTGTDVLVPTVGSPVVQCADLDNN